MGHYIYVISGEQGAVKVGIARDVERRRHELQASCPIELAARYVGAVRDRKAAEAAELRAHRILRSYRSHGEWFKASVKMAVDAVIVACAELDITLLHVVDPRSGFKPRPDDLDAKRAEAWARALWLRKRRG